MSKEHLFSLTKKDFIVEYFKGSGAGGQHRNKNATAVRIKHPASKAMAECQNYKSREQNKKEAFNRLYNTNEFQHWLKIEISKALGKLTGIEDKVDEWMKEENLKIEYF
ncbi:MAG: peptide chain release factor family protein [bacterium]